MNQRQAEQVLLLLMSGCSLTARENSSPAVRALIGQMPGCRMFTGARGMAGEPKFQTVAGNPFMQWAKLCPAEAIDGIKFIDGFWERFRQELQKLRRDATPDL